MRGTGRLGHGRHFSLAKQQALIASHGVNVLVIPTLACPCVTTEGQYNPNDTHCRGTGRWPQEALQYALTLALIEDTGKRAYHEPGSWWEGSILCLAPPDVDVVANDLVRMTEVQDTFNDDVLQRGVRDTVRFISGVTIERVADFTGTYRAGQDYTLAPPNRIAWLPGRGPAAQARYSVKYTAFAEYLVFLDSPRLRVEGHREQSTELRLMRLDKLVRN
jgi:hypothetical protein